MPQSLAGVSVEFSWFGRLIIPICTIAAIFQTQSSRTGTDVDTLWEEAFTGDLGVSLVTGESRLSNGTRVRKKIGGIELSHRTPTRPSASVRPALSTLCA